MQTIDNFNFKDKKALIRVDYNVPLDDAFQITETSRIDATIQTIKKITGPSDIRQIILLRFGSEIIIISQ